MKRVIMAIALILIAGSGFAYAQERTELEAGIKFWLNDWERKDPSFGSNTTDSVMLIGPAVGIKFPNYVFLEAAYLFSTSDYKFTDAFGIAKWERQDLELTVGYMIVEEFGILAGYKNTWYKEKESGVKEEVYGPLLGVTAKLPVNEVFSFYGNLYYLFTKFKEESVSPFSEDNPGWIGEFGLQYAFTRQFNGKLGYKYETTKGKDSDVEDTFSGLTLAAMVAF